MMGGGTTQQTTQGPPQLIAQGTPGYLQAENFFQNTLANPPSTVSGPSPVQQQAFQAAGNLSDPNAEAAAVGALAQPLFRQFESSTMPAIRDRSQMSGQGVDGTRRGVAEATAEQNLGQGLFDEALGKIFQQQPERVLAQQSVGGSERDIVNQMLNDLFGKQTGAATSLMQAAGSGPGSSSMTGSSSPGVLGGLQQGTDTAASLATILALSRSKS